MAQLEKEYVPSKNSIDDQKKAIRDKITAEEWNTLWNTIKTQTNDTATYLKKLYDFITGGGDVGEFVELDGESMIEVLKEKGQGVHFGPTEPTEPKEDDIWFQTDN